MNKLDILKLVMALLMCGVALTGAFLAFCYQFDWFYSFNSGHFADVHLIFGRGDEGGASTTPIFYGLFAISGVYLLSTVKTVKE